MRKGQRKIRSGSNTIKKSEGSPVKCKTSKKEFQGKLSHASPNSRITQYYQPEPLNNEGVKPLSPIDIKAELCNCKNTHIKNVCENSSTEVENTAEQLIGDEHDIFLQPGCSELPLLSHMKSVNAENANLKLPLQTSKRTIKNKKRPTGVSSAKVPPLSESKSCDNNHKLTEYFPVRRSARKTKKVVLEEKQKHLEEAVISKCEDGLQVRIFEGKGRGIIATREFCKGEFVVEYAGELISLDEAKTREKMYANDQNTGCYMYYFKHKNVHYCVDATPESDRLGRLVNHSRSGNLVTKTVEVDNRPHLVLIAKETIQPGDEITYDYGDRSKESLYYHPWLAL